MLLYLAMPNIKSAKKRVKTSERNKLRNYSQKSAMRTAVRNVRDLALGGNMEDALLNLPEAFSKIDKAVKRKIIHANAGARLKSRLVAKIKTNKA
jgi:small subunit ribosomal protein S20